MLDYIPKNLKLYWLFFIILCMLPMAFALIGEKKAKERKRQIEIKEK